MFQPRITLGRDKRFLVYDVETYATGFADPQWVPQVITCVSWKWYGKSARSAKVSASVDYFDPDCPMGHLDPSAVSGMLEPFLNDLHLADAVITYNGRRFDNPVLNGMMWYTGMLPVQPFPTYDLHYFGKIKGVKRGLDNLAVFLGVAGHKQAMNHAQWQEAYLTPGWPEIKSRARSDVVLTEQLFDAIKKRGWLKPPVEWKP